MQKSMENDTRNPRNPLLNTHPSSIMIEPKIASPTPIHQRPRVS